MECICIRVVGIPWLHRHQVIHYHYREIYELLLKLNEIDQRYLKDIYQSHDKVSLGSGIK